MLTYLFFNYVFLFFLLFGRGFIVVLLVFHIPYKYPYRNVVGFFIFPKHTPTEMLNKNTPTLLHLVEMLTKKDTKKERKKY